MRTKNMQRIIKFRGRATKEVWASTDKISSGKINIGDWVYGYYQLTPDNRHVIHISKGVIVRVDPETVGQYVGRRDENDSEVYEGDILETNERKLSKELFQVEWSDMNSGWRAFHIDEFVAMEAYKFSSSRIVGNIHENPGLLSRE